MMLTCDLQDQFLMLLASSRLADSTLADAQRRRWEQRAFDRTGPCEEECLREHAHGNKAIRESDAEETYLLSGKS